MKLENILQNRIAIIDGAMGTMIQRYKLSEEDYRGEKFANHSSSLKGCNDLLVITKPQIITDIHLAYIEAGADIIETNTFNANILSLADYQLENYDYEINFQAALVARKAVEIFYNKTNNSRPVFVAGALGPTSKTASLSPDVNDPGFRAVTFDDLVIAYKQQTKALVEGGVDLLLVETVFDTLNAKAALFAIDEYFEESGNKIPIMVSGTITDQSGRTLSGQTTEAFYNSISHADLFSVGLNCALGAEMMRPYLEELSNVSTCYVSVYPNAGLPNAMGEYDETPAHMASVIKEFAQAGFINIVGGCCGTTPDHISAIAGAVKNYPPRKVPVFNYQKN